MQQCMERTNVKVPNQKLKPNKKGDKEMVKGPREVKDRGGPTREMDLRDKCPFGFP